MPLAVHQTIARFRSRVFLALLGVIVGGAALLGLVGCDTAFEAYEETGLVYSVSGYLDVMADTQWVRVEPLQDSSLVGGGPLDVRITTRNLATGEEVVWRDTVIQVGGTTEQLRTAWTTAPLQPDATYRFMVEGPQGTSTAEATVPVRIPPVEVAGTVPPVGSPSPVVRVVHVTAHDVEQLGAAVARVRYRVRKPGSLPQVRTAQDVFSFLEDATREQDGSYRVRMDWEEKIRPLMSETEEFLGFYAFTVSVASVATWPDYGARVDSLRGRALPPPGVDSNVEDGIGFLGGAATRTVAVPLAGQ